MQQPRKIRTSSRIQQLPQPVYTFTQVQAIQQQQQHIQQLQKEEKAKKLKIKEEKELKQQQKVLEAKALQQQQQQQKLQVYDDQEELQIQPKQELKVTKLILTDPCAALPSKLQKKARRFCDVCGYWGIYKCTKEKCLISYCSLQCKAVHEETRCQKFVA